MSNIFFFTYSSSFAKSLKTMRRITRSMSRAQESVDIKPDTPKIVYPEVNARSKRFSQTQTFRSMEDRTKNGKVYGAESDIHLIEYIKKEPGDSGKIKVCQHEINLRLSKP